MDLIIADVTELPEDAARPGAGRSSSAPRCRSTTSRRGAARSAIRCSRASGRAIGDVISNPRPAVRDKERLRVPAVRGAGTNLQGARWVWVNENGS